ncbi:hypothetical protein M9H77_09172 [Catharanthus roseus]|uniref:Uncharacterized protein n=1 Tax=Catharanthus roseus TaxID=4058 RepID=A0ACC0C058_CATRO|nr:hypothetical protein M9H77_09172 [Catharanthus roseus]
MRLDLRSKKKLGFTYGLISIPKNDPEKEEEWGRFYKCVPFMFEENLGYTQLSSTIDAEILSIITKGGDEEKNIIQQEPVPKVKSVLARICTKEQHKIIALSAAMEEERGAEQQAAVAGVEDSLHLVAQDLHNNSTTAKDGFMQLLASMVEALSTMEAATRFLKFLQTFQDCQPSNDLGCSNHVTSRKGFLRNFRSIYPYTIDLPNRAETVALHEGDPCFQWFLLHLVSGKVAERQPHIKKSLDNLNPVLFMVYTPARLGCVQNVYIEVSITRLPIPTPDQIGSVLVLSG